MEIIRLFETDTAVAARRAIEVLKQGGIVLYPTDTLYGLAVDALNPKAIERLRQLKTRERGKPISIVVHSVKAIDDHVVLSEEARALAERHLPGKLTLVLPARSHIPKELTLNGTLGVRIPDDAFVEALSVRYQHPFTATSANLAGMPTGKTVPEIFDQFGKSILDVDLVIDDGERAGGIASTVVTYKDGKLQVLREGAITREELGL